MERRCRPPAKVTRSGSLRLARRLRRQRQIWSPASDGKWTTPLPRGPEDFLGEARDQDVASLDGGETRRLPDPRSDSALS